MAVGFQVNVICEIQKKSIFVVPRASNRLSFLGAGVLKFGTRFKRKQCTNGSELEDIVIVRQY